MYDLRRTYFDSIASDWNKKVRVPDHFKLWLRKFDIKAGERILDVGAGTGRLSSLLSHHVGWGGQVVSVDFSRAMLQEATREGLNGSLYFVCADALELSFCNDCFDKVICYSAFPHFRDQKRALIELRRVLAPHGILYIVHAKGSSSLNIFHKNLGGAVANDIMPGGSDMHALLEECRFQHIDVIDQPALYWANARK